MQVGKCEVQPDCEQLELLSVLSKPHRCWGCWGCTPSTPRHGTPHSTAQTLSAAAMYGMGRGMGMGGMGMGGMGGMPGGGMPGKPSECVVCHMVSWPACPMTSLGGL